MVSTSLVLHVVLLPGEAPVVEDRWGAGLVEVLVAKVTVGDDGLDGAGRCCCCTLLATTVHVAEAGRELKGEAAQTVPAEAGDSAHELRGCFLLLSLGRRAHCSKM